MMTGKDGQPLNSNEVFQRVRARLKAAVGEDVFNSWFARLELEEIVDDLAHLSVPTRFLCSWVQSNYSEKFSRRFAPNPPASPGCISPSASTVRHGHACTRLKRQAMRSKPR